MSLESLRLEELQIPPARAADRDVVLRHLDSLTKPRGSLGKLEDLALRLALIYGDPPPALRRRVIYLLAADHGVARHGVSAYPSEVTAQMCHNYSSGGAAISVLGRSLGIEIVAVDIGVDGDLAGVTGLLHRKIRRGSADLSSGPALSVTEVMRAIDQGMELVTSTFPLPDVVGLGEMGIGSSTAASAVTSALTGTPAHLVVGPGTGLDAAGVARKAGIVSAAVSRLQGSDEPLRVLAEVGGLEIAGLVGVMLGAAAGRRAVVTDGFIATAAALAAVRLHASAGDYLIASHRSPEPGHSIQLAALGVQPLLDLGMRLGEGTGAALAMPLLDAACALLREMATFAAAGVSTATASTAS